MSDPTVDNFVPPSPLYACASVIIAMSVLAAGNGLMFAYVPLKLASEGFPPWLAGSMVSALALGGLVSCFVTGKMVERTGHARVYMVFSALVILSNAVIGFQPNGWSWLLARCIYGFAMAGQFIVVQSWLNDIITNEIRGRVISIFYMAYMVSIGIGAYAIALVDVDSTQAPVLAIIAVTFSLLAIGQIRTEPPPTPQTASVELRLVWNTSPIGLTGMLAVGGLSSTLFGFVPIFGADEGFSTSKIALLLALMPLGMIFVQMPLGALSDRIDRRLVLVVASVLVVVGALAASLLSGSSFILVLGAFALWSGAAETIYSVSNAHASDRAEAGEMVKFSSTMLFAWSLSGFCIPTITTILTGFYGTQAFMLTAIGVGGCYGLFVLWRMSQAEAVPEEDSGSYVQLSAQTPLTPEFAVEPEELAAALEAEIEEET